MLGYIVSVVVELVNYHFFHLLVISIIDFYIQGFVAAVTHLRPHVPAIYNITIAIPKNDPCPTLLRIFRGHSSTVCHEFLYILFDTIAELC